MQLTEALVFLPAPPASSLLYVGVYDPKLVVLSIVIAVFAAVAALDVADRIRPPVGWRTRLSWLALGALALGGGIWAMHFIGMLALQLPCSVSYDASITLWSILPGILASGAAIDVIRYPQPSQLRLLTGSVLLGAGIGTMHYTGMAAMRIEGLLRYDPRLFALSLAVAIVLAYVALLIRSRVESPRWRVAVPAAVMGGAVAGMHYTAMAATYFLRAGDAGIVDSALPPMLLATNVSVVTGLLIGMVLAATVAGRYRETLQQLRENEAYVRQAVAVFENTAEGVIITDPTGRIRSVNPAFTLITGYAEAEVVGHNASLLKSGRHDADFYRLMWAEIVLADQWQGEIWNRRKNGEIYPEWLTISTVRDKAGKVQGYIGVFSDISGIKRAAEELERLAHYDPLTRLANRLLLNAQLQHSLERAERHGELLGVMEIDLDGFKNVNDTLGHPAGDKLLQIIAERLRAVLRGEDIVARLGGDEFAVVLESLDSADSAGTVAEKVIAAVAEPADLDGYSARVTASIGIALFPADGADATALLKAADTALYVGKREGRNTYRFYDARMSEAVHRRLDLEQGLRKAIDEGGLELWYQPQIDLKNGCIAGAEALVRWRHPERGIVPPGEFLPVASDTGLIVPLGEWVLRAACRQVQSWLAAGIDIGRIAVNVDSQQIMRSDFVTTVESVLAETALAPGRLELEITENFLLENAENGMGTVARFSYMGVNIAIDDFGTGYSSLAYLKYLHADCLKIDKSFVNDLPNDSTGAAIVRTVISLGRGLGFLLVAEGVENIEQLNYLRMVGCDLAQGYHIARPMPAAEFERWLAASPYRPAAST